MKDPLHVPFGAFVLAIAAISAAVGADRSAVVLPEGLSEKAVWDLGKAYRETTPTRERICINGLWRWQPADEVGETVPADNWGYYKVPAPWSANSQTLYPHPTWKGKNLRRGRRGLVPARDHDPRRLAGATHRRLCRVPQLLCGRVSRRQEGGRHVLPVGRGRYHRPPAAPARSTSCRCASRRFPWPR